MSGFDVLREKETAAQRLLPCRFCGKTPIMAQRKSLHRKEGRDPVWRVKCRTKKCPGKSYKYFLTAGAAAAAWNSQQRGSLSGRRDAERKKAPP